jgi:hypothetical protein
MPDDSLETTPAFRRRSMLNLALTLLFSNKERLKKYLYLTVCKLWSFQNHRKHLELPGFADALKR